jgi:hypothetical protein
VSPDVGLAAVVEETVGILDDEVTGEPGRAAGNGRRRGLSADRRGLVVDLRGAARRPAAHRLQARHVPRTPAPRRRQAALLHAGDTRRPGGLSRELRATRGGWFSASIHDETADPRERAILVQGGIHERGRCRRPRWRAGTGFSRSTSTPTPGRCLRTRPGAAGAGRACAQRATATRVGVTTAVDDDSPRSACSARLRRRPGTSRSDGPVPRLAPVARASEAGCNSPPVTERP